MKQLNTYLFFPGNCEEALNFYKESIGGNITFIQRFGETPIEIPDDYKEKIIHSEFRSEELVFMASDTMKGQPIISGNQISLSINLSDEKEQNELFNKLSMKGKIIMPLEETFWGARFGMLTDKYGINWMLNLNR